VQCTSTLEWKESSDWYSKMSQEWTAVKMTFSLCNNREMNCRTSGIFPNLAFICGSGSSGLNEVNEEVNFINREVINIGVIHKE
jgi:hypothetical protein